MVLQVKICVYLLSLVIGSILPISFLTSCVSSRSFHQSERTGAAADPHLTLKAELSSRELVSGKSYLNPSQGRPKLLKTGEQWSALFSITSSTGKEVVLLAEMRKNAAGRFEAFRDQKLSPHPDLLRRIETFLSHFNDQLFSELFLVSSHFLLGHSHKHGAAGVHFFSIEEDGRLIRLPSACPSLRQELTTQSGNWHFLSQEPRRGGRAGGPARVQLQRNGVAMHCLKPQGVSEWSEERHEQWIYREQKFPLEILSSSTGRALDFTAFRQPAGSLPFDGELLSSAFTLGYQFERRQEQSGELGSLDLMTWIEAEESFLLLSYQLFYDFASPIAPEEVLQGYFTPDFSSLHVYFGPEFEFTSLSPFEWGRKAEHLCREDNSLDCQIEFGEAESITLHVSSEGLSFDIRVYHDDVTEVALSKMTLEETRRAQPILDQLIFNVFGTPDDCLANHLNFSFEAESLTNEQREGIYEQFVAWYYQNPALYLGLLRSRSRFADLPKIAQMLTFQGLLDLVTQLKYVPVRIPRRSSDQMFDRIEIRSHRMQASAAEWLESLSFIQREVLPRALSGSPTVYNPKILRQQVFSLAPEESLPESVIDRWITDQKSL